jgi:hypothetical protein
LLRRCAANSKHGTPSRLVGGGWGEGYVRCAPLPPTPSLKGSKGRGSAFSPSLAGDLTFSFRVRRPQAGTRSGGCCKRFATRQARQFSYGAKRDDREILLASVLTGWPGQFSLRATVSRAPGNETPVRQHGGAGPAGRSGCVPARARNKTIVRLSGLAAYASRRRPNTRRRAGRWPRRSLQQPASR